MGVAPPPDERGRLEALRRYAILDSAPEAAFDRLTALCARLFSMPMALVSLVDSGRVWFKAHHGFAEAQAPRAGFFCAHAIHSDEVMVVEEARADSRFATHPLVAGTPGICCYAGAPLITPEGYRIGTLCVMGAGPETFDRGQTGVLQALATTVMDLLEARARSREQALFAGAFRHAPVGISISDEPGRFLAVNDAHCRMLGYSEAELLAQPFTMVVPREARAFAERAHAALFQGRAAVPSQGRLLRKDASTLEVQLASAPLELPDGTRCRVTTITDVSELKLNEAQLRQAQKMEAISRLAGGAAHGFNNLLTIITGYAQLLKASMVPGDPFHTYAAEILQASERAAAVTGKLLAFSRRHFGEPGVVDLNALVERVSGPAAVRVKVACVLERELVRVIADPEQLELGIGDLVQNAMEAMPGGGTLTLRTANLELSEADLRQHPTLLPGRYAMLQVEDTGTGMDEETKRHLFEPFFTTKGPGKGTGLAVLYGIVRQWGGEVAVASERDNGTTVTILLPAAPA